MTASHVKASPKGFSLVELSIVLVIIGLLVGGILTGQSLIHASSLRATIAQITELNQNVTAFRDKYQGLPGDLTNAQDFWGTAVAANGNGNEIIEAASGCSPTFTNSEPDCPMFNGERSQFYVQLGLAGLAPAYDGSAVLGKGYPSIKLNPSTGMFVAGKWVIAGGSNMNIHLYALDPIYLYMGVCNTGAFNVSSGHNDCAIFLPEDAWNMDTKLDDGMPLSGKILGESFNTACLTGSEYNVSVTSAACNLLVSLH